MSKHTPGPWHQAVNYSFGMSNVCFRDEVGTSRMIADCSPDPLKDIPEAEANARLIAAAPELLEACKEIVGMIDRGDLVRSTEGDGDPDWVLRMMKFVPRLKKVSDAITKAEGK